jgi:hypothetical protein
MRHAKYVMVFVESVLSFSVINLDRNMLTKFSKKFQIRHVAKVSPVVFALFHAEGWTIGHLRMVVGRFSHLYYEFFCSALLYRTFSRKHTAESRETWLLNIDACNIRVHSIIIILINQLDATLCSLIYSDWDSLYMFRAPFAPIIRSTIKL